MTIPFTFGLSITLHALKNSSGLNCKFDICTCVRALISLFKKLSCCVMKKIAVVHCGKVKIIIKYYRLSHDVVT